jgi:hypothetical protein
MSAAACAATMLPDGRVLVWGEEFPDRDAAIAWAAYVAGSREGSRVISGPSLPVDAVREACADSTVSRAGAGDLRTGLPLVRVLVRQGRLVHGGDPALSGQVHATRVAPREGGLVIPHRSIRTDLVRAMTYAASAVVGGVAAPLPRPAIF